MAKTLSKTGILKNNTIQAWHVTQSIDALTGTKAYDITISGSLDVEGNISASSLLYSSASEGGGTDTVAMYNTESGQFFYTASSAIGGGGSGGSSLWYDGTTYLSSSKDIQITGSLIVSASNPKGTVSAWKYKDLSNQELLFGDGSYTYLSSDNLITFRVNSNDHHTINDKGLVLNKGFVAASTNTLEVSGSTLLSGSLNVIGDDTTPLGHITSSGNISASGDLYGDNAYFDTRVVTPMWRTPSAEILATNGDLTINAAVTASGDISSSATSTSSFGLYLGDGSQLSNLPGGSTFPFEGDAVITGSLIVSGSFMPLGKATDDTNVIIGKDAAPNITSTSGKNVLIGNEAGGTGTLADADGNVCIGYQAGYEIDGGDNNVCIGNQAGYLMDGNAGVIAIGYQVMRNAVNNYGVGIGDSAGRFQQNNPNTLIGGYAGYGVSGQSDARYNAALGYTAGYLLRDGYYNVIIGGEKAGYNINDGYGNIILGTYAGKNIVDGDYNIIIGHSASFGADVSNQLFIGSASFATISASLTTGDIIFPSTASATYFVGDGSQLTNLPGGGSTFPFEGDAVITGSLLISGSFNAFKLDTTAVILGTEAGANLTATSVDNTLIGYQAGTNTTAGDQNVLIGQGAGQTGDHTQDVAIGYWSGLGYTGGFNVSIGYHAGYGANVASAEKHNTQIGAQAGRNNWRGSGNTFIGYSAGFNGYDNEGCIIIGSGSIGGGDVGAGGLTQQLRIGNGADIVTISASLETGDIIFSGDINGSGGLFISGSSTLGDALTDTITIEGHITASGNLDIGGELIQTGVVTTSGGSAPTITGKSVWRIATDGTAAGATLADGTVGQRLTVYCYDHSSVGSVTVTPSTSPSNYSTILFNENGESIDLIFDTSKGWIIIGTYGATIS